MFFNAPPNFILCFGHVIQAPFLYGFAMNYCFFALVGALLRAISQPNYLFLGQLTAFGCFLTRLRTLIYVLATLFKHLFFYMALLWIIVFFALVGALTRVISQPKYLFLGQLTAFGCFLTRLRTLIYVLATLFKHLFFFFSLCVWW